MKNTLEKNIYQVEFDLFVFFFLVVFPIVFTLGFYLPFFHLFSCLKAALLRRA